MRAALLVVLAIIICAFATAPGAFAQQVVFSANSDQSGATVFFANTGTDSYLQFKTVDGNVNRLRIVDSRNYVFFDGHPSLNQTIYLPPGNYQASAWSAWGTSLPAGIQASFVSTPGNSQPQTAGNSGDYGFKKAAGGGDYTEVKSVGSPPYYYDNYNYGPGYYPNYNQSITIETPSHPSSVLDPSYGESQHSVLSPSYTEGQHTIFDKSW